MTFTIEIGNLYVLNYDLLLIMIQLYTVTLLLAHQVPQLNWFADHTSKLRELQL